MFSRIALALVASASMLPLAAEAQAQDTTASEEIVVTAQKREELLREIPQSVTAITEETLERLQANDFSDYVGRIPGMVATGDQPGNTRLVLRGVNNGGIGSAVATYVDETPFGSSSGLVNAAELALDLDPFDVARVEVLRGPQGTLYGATALSGLIRFVTRDPSPDDFEFRTRLTMETTESGEASYNVRAGANIPLGDQAALRISGFDRTIGGFIDGVRDNNVDGSVDAGDTVFEDYNQVDTSGARAAFLLHASDNIDIRLSAMIQDIESHNFNNVQYDIGADRAIGDPTHGDLVRLGADFDNIADTAYRIYNGTVNWDLGFATLTSSSSYGELDQFRLLGDNTVVGIRQDNNVLQDKFTQEFRLTSPSSDGLEWQAGVFYTEENGLVNQFQDFQPLLTQLGFVPVLAFILGITEDEVLAEAHITADLSTYEELALFGNATYHFSPQFDVNVGLRHARNEQTFDQIITHTSVSPFLVALGDAYEESDEAVTTYSISPRWRPNEDTMVYGRIASGYRPGGPNVAVLGSTAVPPTYDSDTTVNYEIGIKTDLVDNLLGLDAAVFYIDWSDVQLLVAEDVGGQLIAGNSNGGDAISKGFEWSATLTPMEGLSVLWTSAYTDAYLSSPPPPEAALAMSEGDQLPYSPDWSSSLDIDYEWTAFGDTTAYVGGGVRYVSDQMSGFATIFAPAEDQLDVASYTLVDLRAGLNFDNVTLEVFARNVGDERGPVQIGPAAPLDAEDGAVLRPRTVGVTLTAEF